MYSLLCLVGSAEHAAQHCSRDGRRAHSARLPGVRPHDPDGALPPVATAVGADLARVGLHAEGMGHQRCPELSQGMPRRLGICSVVEPSGRALACSGKRSAPEPAQLDRTARASRRPTAAVSLLIETQHIELHRMIRSHFRTDPRASLASALRHDGCVAVCRRVLVAGWNDLTCPRVLLVISPRCPCSATTSFQLLCRRRNRRTREFWWAQLLRAQRGLAQWALQAS